jgi:hypothetical protein
LDILKKLNLAIDLDNAGDKERKDEITQSGLIPKMFNFYLKCIFFKTISFLPYVFQIISEMS